MRARWCARRRATRRCRTSTPTTTSNTRATRRSRCSARSCSTSSRCRTIRTCAACGRRTARRSARCLRAATTRARASMRCSARSRSTRTSDDERAFHERVAGRAMSESSYTRVPVLGRQVGDFLVAGALALVIASAAFVGVRNRELAARQVDLASRSADAVAEGRDALPTVHAASVSEPRVSTKHPFLRRRTIHEGSRSRVLGAEPHNADDKLFYDAANRAPVSEILPDGTGRALVAKKAPDGIAIASTAPAAPESYPPLVFVGVLGLGAALAAAGAVGQYF